MRKRNLLKGAAAAALLLSADIMLSLPASAQIDEIIVTARKREESIQDVPISVTAFSTEQIEQINPRTLQDLDGFAPNVFVGQQTAIPGGGAIYIRGEGYSDVEKTQNPSVGVILDDVFLGVNTGQLIDAFDMQSLEILRGPQGVLFGKNTTGGVLKATRSRPTGEFGAKVSAGYGAFEHGRFRFVGNAPIIPDLIALKIGGTLNNREGYTDNVFLGSNEGSVEYKSANAELLITPVEGLEILLGYDFIEDRSGLLPVELISLKDEQFTGFGDFGGDAQYDAKIYRAKLDWDTSFGTFTSITAIMDTSDRAFQDFDATNFGPGAPENAFLGPTAFLNNPLIGLPLTGNQLHTDRAQEYDQLTQELRWNETFLDDRIDVLLGGFYYRHQVNLTQFTDSYNDAIGCGVLTACAVFTGGFGTADGVNSEQNSGEENHAYSAFGSILVDIIPDRLSASFGLRHIHEEKNQYSRFDDLIFPGIETIVPNTEDSWNYTTPKVSVDLNVTEDILLYGYYAQGFRSGGISIRGVPDPALFITVDDLSYDPEIVKTFEFGMKSQWFEDQLRANISGFLSDREGSQSNIVSVRPGGTPTTNTIILNVDKVNVSGIEMELQANPDFIEGLTVSANYGWLVGQNEPQTFPLGPFGVGPTSVCPEPDLATFTCQGSVAGLTRSPESQGGATVSYTRQIGIGDLNVNANWLYRSEVEWIGGFNAFDGNLQDAYHLVNGGISYSFELNGVDLRADFTGKNILDEEYATAALPNIDFQSFGAPRTWFFELTANYN